MVCYNQDGSEKWKLATELFLESTPSISGDTIYIGSYTDESTGAGLYAISNKKIKWHLALQTREVMLTPAMAEEGTVYIGDVDGVFYALNPDGTIKWSFDTGGEISSSAALGSDGTIYFGSSTGIFYALNSDGTEKWSYSASSIASSPAIGEDGTVYIGSWDGKLYAFGGKEINETEHIPNPNEEPSYLEENISNEELNQEEPEKDSNIEEAQDNVQEKSSDGILILLLAGLIILLGIIYFKWLKNKH